MSDTSNSNTTTQNTSEGNSDVNSTENQQDSQSQSVQPQVQPNKKKFKIKVDGKDEEMEIDLSDEAAITRHLQMSKVAAKRMNEAAITRKQAEQFIHALQSDPMRVLSDPRVMGSEKFQAIAEQFLAKKLQEQMLSPEERKRIEMEEKLRQYEEQDKKQKQDVEAKQIQALEEHYAQQYQKTIMDSLQSSNLPKNPFTVKRMAELMQKNIQHGLDLEPTQLAQLVREDYQRELVSLIGSSDADQIISMFGEDLTTKIRKHDLAKLKANQGSLPTHRNQPNSPQSNSGSAKPMTKDEWKAVIERRAKE